SGIFNLKEKLGPILWQFPPSFRFNPDLFEAFLAELPHDTGVACRIATKHDERMNGTATSIDQPRPMRHAVEIRNQSFVDPSFVDMLRHYDIAMVVADTAKRWPEFEDVCADFMYLRLHGATELYVSGYTEEALNDWARRIEAWARGAQPGDAKLISHKAAPKRARRDVFCYFDNTDKVKAPSNAMRLLEKLGIQHVSTFSLDSGTVSKTASKSVAAVSSASNLNL
ncbi:MAG TPA: DUF72 domain-containing protein, partial [Rhodocyclaceae bacterium]|nr:DUF72 domain-containing protein [Rhodocyclaceae bacterium]